MVVDLAVRVEQEAAFLPVGANVGRALQKPSLMNGSSLRRF